MTLFASTAGTPTGQPTITGFLEGIANPNTYGAYATDLRDLAASLSPGVVADWRHLKASHLARYVDGMRRRGLKPATVERKVASARSFLRWALGAAALEGALGRALAPPRVAHPPPRVLTDQEVGVLLARVDGMTGPMAARDAAMLRLLLTAGPTAPELVGLDVADVTWGDGYARVGRGNRARALPLDQDTVRWLRDYLAFSRPWLCRLMPQAASPAAALFLNHNGGRLTRQGFWLIVKGHARAAGLVRPDRINASVLRHTYAVRLLAGGAIEKDAQYLLGHAHLGTTQRYRPLVQAARRSRVA